jgi:hypothetical protein
MEPGYRAWNVTSLTKPLTLDIEENIFVIQKAFNVGVEIKNIRQNTSSVLALYF